MVVRCILVNRITCIPFSSKETKNELKNLIGICSKDPDKVQETMIRAKNLVLDVYDGWKRKRNIPVDKVLRSSEFNAAVLQKVKEMLQDK